MLENKNDFLDKPLASNLINDSHNEENHHNRHSLKSKQTYVFENRIEYYLILIGYVIGFGSFWRFPYLIYSNGGGTFVLVFIIVLAIIGIPIFYLETFFGQIYKKGPVEFFKSIHPKFGGVGWSMCIVTWLLSSYYCIILVWSYYYLFASFTWPLPWSNEIITDEFGNALPYINKVSFYLSIGIL